VERRCFAHSADRANPLAKSTCRAMIDPECCGFERCSDSYCIFAVGIIVAKTESHILSHQGQRVCAALETKASLVKYHHIIIYPLKEVVMKRPVLHKLVLIGIAVGATLHLVASHAAAYSAPWLDQVIEAVIMEKELAKSGNYDSYLQQLTQVRTATEKGDFIGVRKGLDRFLEMIESKQGGISADAADRIFLVTFKVAPYRALLPLHQEDKLDPAQKKAVERVKRLAAKIAESQERAALSF